jgi:hypothetical protein
MWVGTGGPFKLDSGLSREVRQDRVSPAFVPACALSTPTQSPTVGAGGVGRRERYSSAASGNGLCDISERIEAEILLPLGCAAVHTLPARTRRKSDVGQIIVQISTTLRVAGV